MGFFSKDIKNMEDLFVHTLRDIYYAEKQLARTPLGAKAAEDRLAQRRIRHQLGIAGGNGGIALGQDHVHVRQHGREERPVPVHGLERCHAIKAAINALLSGTPKSEVRATLDKARRDAIINLSSGGTLNATRAKVGITISNVIHGLPTQEKIDKAKLAINVWIVELEAAKL
jgi:hypothetical protein